MSAFKSLSINSTAIQTAFKTGIPRHEKIRQMVDLPDPIPPVRPIIGIRLFVMIMRLFFD
jgi:hypothetical protein